MSVIPPVEPPEAENDNSRPLMIFAVISSVVVIAVMIVLFVIGVLPRISGDNGQNFNDPDGPFLTLKRPVPTSANLYDIFPVQVGEFTGETWLGDVDNGFTITYRRGADTLTVMGRQTSNIAAARFLVEEIRNKRGPANRAERFLPGQFSNSYYLDVRENDIRFAWNRDVWFFDVSTSSVESLTAFMNTFQY
jgi:hypothetical protein